MKIIRYFAGSLMVITGILHLLPILTASGNPDAIPMLIFGIAFLAIGMLLFLNKPISQILGVIIPAIGFTIGLFKVGLGNLDAILGIMFIIDVIVIICCIILLLNRKKVEVVE